MVSQPGRCAFEACKAVGIDYTRSRLAASVSRCRQREKPLWQSSHTANTCHGWDHPTCCCFSFGALPMREGVRSVVAGRSSSITRVRGHPLHSNVIPAALKETWCTESFECVFFTKKVARARVPRLHFQRWSRAGVNPGMLRNTGVIMPALRG